MVILTVKPPAAIVHFHDDFREPKQSSVRFNLSALASPLLGWMGFWKANLLVPSTCWMCFFWRVPPFFWAVIRV